MYTHVVDLLKQCGWLSVKQLVVYQYHSVILVYKTLQTTFLRYICNKLASEFPYSISLAELQAVRMGPEFRSRLELTERSFMQRATVSFKIKAEPKPRTLQE